MAPLVCCPGILGLVIHQYQCYNLTKKLFIWSPTSSYQVEGGNVNVWDRWAQQGKCPRAAGQACDHWNRYKEDSQLIQNLGANSYRMSVEWSRIEPQQGVFDEAALDHYAAMCDDFFNGAYTRYNPPSLQ